ncbi:hypothetical protein [Cellulomonas sp. KRMCY2]|uniref:hypothetical protein n=1 Tax=Cellulomonas sp. KRMCY2 TaxID=1304865 RepID=UPI00045E7321|nr:hypothetical protein [Cellulomonas sp. KRMCY2]
MSADRTSLSTASGPGRVLVAVYGVLAVAATARSAVQIVRDLDEAPLAYLLSAVAAAVYVLATVALAKGTGGWRATAWSAVSLELTGVLVVGALSVGAPELFADATVWSGFGSGYGYVPLVLPALGLLWLWRTRPRWAVDSR